jgi:hypothetical protein
MKSERSHASPIVERHPVPALATLSCVVPVDAMRTILIVAVATRPGGAESS